MPLRPNAMRAAVKRRSDCQGFVMTGLFIGTQSQQGAVEGRGADREGVTKVSKRKAQDMQVELGTGNVYADLRYGDADEMLGVLLREVLDAERAGDGEVDRLAAGLREPAQRGAGELDEARRGVAGWRYQARITVGR